MSEKTPAGRRDFLKLALLGAASGAGLAATGAGAKEAEAAGAKREGSAGYRETAHVRKYYELARF